MATKFSVWVDEPVIGSNTQNYSTFAEDSQRQLGFAAGQPASSIRINTALRQSTLVTAAFMNAIAPDSELDMNSSLTDITELIDSSILTNTNLTQQVENAVINVLGSTSNVLNVGAIKAPTIGGTGLYVRGGVGFPSAWSKIFSDDLTSFSSGGTVASNGQVLTADGLGGVSWQTPSGGGGSAGVSSLGGLSGVIGLEEGGGITTNVTYNRLVLSNIPIEKLQTNDVTNKILKTDAYGVPEWLDLKTINNQSLFGAGNINISGGGTITVDSALSASSENPVQNKVITNALGDKLDANADYVSKLSQGAYNLTGQITIGDGLTLSSTTLALSMDVALSHLHTDGANKILVTDSYGDPEWVSELSISQLSSSGNNQILTTDGSGNVQWASTLTLNQLSKSGASEKKFIRYNYGTVAWDALENSDIYVGSGNSGSFLKAGNQGYSASWSNIGIDDIYVGSGNSGKTLVAGAAGKTANWQYFISSIGGKHGQITLGSGLSIDNNNVLSATGGGGSVEYTAASGTGVFVNNNTYEIGLGDDSVPVSKLAKSSASYSYPILTYDAYGAKWGDLRYEAYDLLSTGITQGYVLTADGSGGCNWLPVSGGSYQAGTNISISGNTISTTFGRGTLGQILMSNGQNANPSFQDLLVDPQDIDSTGYTGNYILCVDGQGGSYWRQCNPDVFIVQ